MTLSHNIRMAVYYRDNGKCHYCETPLPEKGFHVDHVDPQGESSMDNLALSCPSCNSGKGGRSHPDGYKPSKTERRAYLWRPDTDTRQLAQTMSAVTNQSVNQVLSAAVTHYASTPKVQESLKDFITRMGSEGSTDADEDGEETDEVS